MKVLLTGSSGQLGRSIQENKPLDVDLINVSRSDLDLANADSCREAVYYFRPDWVINAAAFTAVDQAESESELAYLINAVAPKVFATALEDIGSRLLQISTDFVFNGHQGFPYKVDQKVNPLSVYGSSKAAGEFAALKCPGSYVLRTSWLYSPIRNNFLKTMLKLHQKKSELGDPLNVVSDQVGCPTSAHTLALASWRIILLNRYFEDHCIFHWTDAGVASWYDFAVAIGEIANEMGLLQKMAEVNPISTSEYPTPANRPSFSLLDCKSSVAILGLSQLHWKRSLSDVLNQMRLGYP